jgi:hypothetical protein
VITPPASAPLGRPAIRRRIWRTGAPLVLALFAADANTVHASFVYDDVETAADTPSIRELWPLSALLASDLPGGITVSGRPQLNLSFALNYAIGGQAVCSYETALHVRPDYADGQRHHVQVRALLRRQAYRIRASLSLRVGHYLAPAIARRSSVSAACAAGSHGARRTHASQRITASAGRSMRTRANPSARRTSGQAGRSSTACSRCDTAPG